MSIEPIDRPAGKTPKLRPTFFVIQSKTQTVLTIKTGQGIFVYYANIALPLPNAHSDEDLVELLRTGDVEAFSELFSRHWERVFTIIYKRISEREVAEELTQEIFLKLWDKRVDLVIKNCSAYLYTCAKHSCINYIESQIARKKHWKYYQQFVPTEVNSTNELVELGDLRLALDKGLMTFPEKAKIIFRMSKLEGFSIKEIAVRLNLSEKAIQYHLTRSIKELRLRLKDFLISLWLFFYL